MESGLDMWRQMRRTMHGVDWRNQLAAEQAQSDRVRMPPELDAATRDAADYVRLKARDERGPIKASQKYPEIALAEAAWGQPALRSAIQSLLIANVPAAELCEKLNLQPSVLQVIEDLYFDVRPMLSAPSWIVSKVIGAEADAGRDDVAAQLRVAYFSGAYVAQELIDARLRLPTELAQQLADSATLLHAKFVQASEMPLSPEQAVELMRLVAEIRRDEKLLQLERDKLAFRIQRWTQRYELAQARRSEGGGDFHRAADNETTATAVPQEEFAAAADSSVEAA